MCFIIEAIQHLGETFCCIFPNIIVRTKRLLKFFDNGTMQFKEYHYTYYLCIVKGTIRSKWDPPGPTKIYI